jgi:hypothetical protein
MEGTGRELIQDEKVRVAYLGVAAETAVGGGDVG